MFKPSAIGAADHATELAFISEQVLFYITIVCVLGSKNKDFHNNDTVESAAYCVAGNFGENYTVLARLFLSTEWVAKDSWVHHNMYIVHTPMIIKLKSLKLMLNYIVDAYCTSARKVLM